LRRFIGKILHSLRRGGEEGKDKGGVEGKQKGVGIETRILESVDPFPEPKKGNILKTF